MVGDGGVERSDESDWGDERRRGNSEWDWTRLESLAL